MAIIELHTEISAPASICFDLARDVGIHTQSAGKTKEKAIAGRTSGLCEEGDTITWEAVHFGIRQILTVKITKLEKYTFFEDEMIKGAFRRMRHEHHFTEENGRTVMRDRFEYKTPFGFPGKLFDALILKKYMTRFLIQRNEILKRLAESKVNKQ